MTDIQKEALQKLRRFHQRQLCFCTIDTGSPTDTLHPLTSSRKGGWSGESTEGSSSSRRAWTR